MNSDNKALVMEYLREGEPEECQIIDMLLLLIDDWAVREAVRHAMQRCEGKLPNSIRGREETKISEGRDTQER